MSESGLCGVCGSHGNSKCERCLKWYCSRKCQKKDWKVHKYLCPLEAVELEPFASLFSMPTNVFPPAPLGPEDLETQSDVFRAFGHFQARLLPMSFGNIPFSKYFVMVDRFRTYATRVNPSLLRCEGCRDDFMALHLKLRRCCAHNAACVKHRPTQASMSWDHVCNCRKCKKDIRQEAVLELTYKQIAMLIGDLPQQLTCDFLGHPQPNPHLSELMRNW